MRKRVARWGGAVAVLREREKQSPHETRTLRS